MRLFDTFERFLWRISPILALGVAKRIRALVKFGPCPNYVKYLSILLAIHFNPSFDAKNKDWLKRLSQTEGFFQGKNYAKSWAFTRPYENCLSSSLKWVITLTHKVMLCVASHCRIWFTYLNEHHNLVYEKIERQSYYSTKPRPKIPFAKMTVATDDKLVYDISPAKTDSFKLVDQFLLFFKTMLPLWGDNVRQFIRGYSHLCPLT